MTTTATDIPQTINSEAFSLENVNAYAAWREQKLLNYPTNPTDLTVNIQDLNAPNQHEKDLIRANCAKTNLSFYRISAAAELPNQSDTRVSLKNFASAFGLTRTEAHRSAGNDAIVALEVTSNKAQAGYIPYTNRRLSWHTDGYYNYHGPNQAIRAMLMHCARPAGDGGENAYLDPHIAYIRLRDENPAYIEALMDPFSMTIPENKPTEHEENDDIRPINIGPVFYIDSENQLNMRFTARTRNIIWKDNILTTEAVAFLNQTLLTDPMIIRCRLDRGEGVICNNVLHNRTGFDKEEQSSSKRLIYRARYYERIN